MPPDQRVPTTTGFVPSEKSAVTCKCPHNGPTAEPVLRTWPIKRMPRVPCEKVTSSFEQPSAVDPKSNVDTKPQSHTGPAPSMGLALDIWTVSLAPTSGADLVGCIQSDTKARDARGQHHVLGRRQASRAPAKKGDIGREMIKRSSCDEQPGRTSAAFDHARQSALADVWQQPDLSLRDRSFVTISALISRNADAALKFELLRALKNGVRPSEIAEAILHLAYYAGWGNAWSAQQVADEIFSSCEMSADDLAPINPVLDSYDVEDEAVRAASVEGQFNEIAPSLVKYTEKLIYLDLWRRPGLERRARYIITVASLISTGNAQHLKFQLTRAMRAGITREEIGEILLHTAFYAGWPSAFSALPYVSEVLSEQGRL